MEKPVRLVVAHDADAARETYRHLRLILVALPTLILVGSIFAAWAYGLDSIEDSISAYYKSPIRDVFVGAMVGAAVCLVAYHARPLEDYALNLAGFYALFVAFVPTQLSTTIDELKSNPAKLDELILSLRVTIGAVLLVTAVFLFVEWRTGHWSYKVLSQNVVTKWFYRGSTVLGIGFLILVGVQSFAGESFEYIHLAATLLLIASMATAVASHAWPEPTGSEPSGSTGRYQLIFWLMTLGGIAVYAIFEWGLKWDHSTIIAEWWEIGLFAAFWILETIRTWHLTSGSGAENSQSAA